MDAEIRTEYLAGFLEEVRSYLPLLREGIGELKHRPDDSEVIAEIYRLVHIIKGASSLIGFMGLSRLCGAMEALLEEANEGNVKLSKTSVDTLGVTMRDIERFINDDSSFDEEEAVQKAEKNFTELLIAGAQGNDSAVDYEDSGESAQLDMPDETSVFDTYSKEDQALFLAEFQGEAEEHLQDLHREMTALEVMVSSRTDISGTLKSVIQTLRRSVHTVKGASAVIGLSELPKYAHEVEDFLDWLYEESRIIYPELVHALTIVLNHLSRLIENPTSAISDQAMESLAALKVHMRQSVPSSGHKVPLDTDDRASETDSASAEWELYPELQEGFQEEAREHMESIDRAARLLEAEVTDSESMLALHKEAVNQIRRSVHTIKGAAAVIGLQQVATFAHSIEDSLDWLYERCYEINPQIIQHLAIALGGLGHLVDAPKSSITDQATASLEELEKEVRSVAMSSTVVESQESTQGSGSLPSALEEYPELLEGFLEEVQEHVESIHQAGQVLEASVDSPGPITKGLQQPLSIIRRSVHTIKGAAAVIGLENISGYAHKVEDYLDWLAEEATRINPEMISALIRTLDDLSVLAEKPYESVTEEFTRDLEKTLSFQNVQETVPDIQETLPDLDDELLDLFQEKEDLDTVLLEEEPTDLLEEDVDGVLVSDSDELLEGFHEEAAEHLMQINEVIQALDAGIQQPVPVTEEHKDMLNQLRRAVHTLKGAAAVTGLDVVADFSHTLEDTLEWLGDEAAELSPAIVTSIAQSLDFLAILIEKPEEGSADKQERLIQDLHRIQKQAVAAEVKKQPKLRPKVKQPEVEENPAAVLERNVQKTIRVNADHVDHMVHLANELLVGVSAFDLRMTILRETLAELELSRNRLKDIALELEKNFEVKALDDLGKTLHRIRETVEEPAQESAGDDFDTLELDRYTQLNLTIRSMNEAAIDVGAIHGNLGMIYGDLDGDISRQRRNARELQLQLARTRMSPMATVVPRLSRTMRDVAQKLDKRVRLTVQGEDVELDRVVWEKLADPFMHLIRNAVHHGIESREERLRKNKSEMANLTIAAERKGNSVVIRVGDDGSGIDFELIRSKARKQGIIKASDQLSEKELMDLIFLPGFSTKEVSEISGRGVGMDVVKANIHALQGNINIETTPGEGTTFVITLPLTMGLVRSLLVKSGAYTYGIPLSDIREIVRVDHGDINFDDKILRKDEEELPFHVLESLLGQAVPHILTDEEEKTLILVIDVHGKPAGLAISEIIGQQELVIRDLGTHLHNVQGISGAAILGDGGLVPVLNMAELATQETISLTLHAPAEELTPLTILIVDDSISVRRVVGRLVTGQGWKAVEAKDGADAMEQLETLRPDLIFLDVEMPRMNGYEFLAKLAYLTDKKDIPVVMLTSRTSAKHRDKAINLGASGFLNKPYKDEELVNIVEKLTSKRTYQKRERAAEASAV
ncbi:Hpt domain-containing protein [Desulfogranum japonicum]|uniref:Hpt domain-containing protein n=1 Tax=Desulfogranum japonicum TaxID=231447 RepID=UPI0003F7B872|nr:Hpt domain-containing protein [Desulfogranum japonicum]